MVFKIFQDQHFDEKTKKTLPRFATILKSQFAILLLMRLFVCRKLLDALYFFAALFFANFESWAPNIFQTPKQNIVMFCLDVWLCKHLSSADDDQPNKTKHVLFCLRTKFGAKG